MCIRDSIGEYVLLSAAIYCASEFAFVGVNATIHTTLNVLLFMVAIAYAIWREKIDVRGLIRAVTSKLLRR